ncbi:hypothetical protein B0A52_00500 [Exophiala mesophila]|uniref:Uncharacterized protein n=1 Tax=Exophiala mesophila TaxID=212818 RepID=A0A438NKA3_EXOME|nr:hypothetical protein B0A52_00500 [Exophiala mesophila]
MTTPSDSVSRDASGPDTSPSAPLKLVMPEDHISQAPGAHDSTDPAARRLATLAHESTGSPERPSYSPVTPTLSHSSAAANSATGAASPPPQWVDEADLEALPLSLDDNPDAIALRAALSILQIQRQQALKDMRDLDRMKAAALQDPDQFVLDLEQGKLNRPSNPGLGSDSLQSSGQSQAESTSKFGRFPTPQNIARTPPIEWKKYHIVGEPLDRLHQVQQHYPGFGQEPQSGSAKPQPHAIAAPYRPFSDRLDDTDPRIKSQPPES